jgi:hypothetical protein
MKFPKTNKIILAISFKALKRGYGQKPPRKVALQSLRAL